MEQEDGVCQDCFYNVSCTGTLSGSACGLTLPDGETSNGALTFLAEELVSGETYTIQASGEVDNVKCCCAGFQSSCVQALSLACICTELRDAQHMSGDVWKISSALTMPRHVSSMDVFWNPSMTNEHSLRCFFRCSRCLRSVVDFRFPADGQLKRHGPRHQRSSRLGQRSPCQSCPSPRFQ